jgi:hypothetical protein
MKTRSSSILTRFPRRRGQSFNLILFLFLFYFFELVKWVYGERCPCTQIGENLPHVSGNSDWIDCKVIYDKEHPNIRGKCANI